MSDTGNRLHIAFGVDENYMHPMGVTITSIIASNPELDMVFHVFTPQITPVTQHRLEQLAQQSGHDIRIHPIDELNKLNRLPVSESLAYISTATYIRLWIPEVLAPITDRVLYLDADILCVGDIAPLHVWDFEQATAAVIQDISPELMRARLNQKVPFQGDYFNAGVLLINIPRWLQSRVSERAMAYIADPALNLRYLDQDALNIVLDGSVQLIDRNWNYQYSLTRSLRKGNAQMEVPAEARFLHFIGPLKPWRVWNPHQSKELFLHYQQLSPWSGVALDEGFSPRERHVYLRFMYQDCLRRQQWLRGLLWYGRFLYQKYVAG